MKASALKYAVVTIAALLATVIIAVVPFHAFLTVWLGDVYGHYTAWRLWKEVLLALLSITALYLIVFDPKVRTHVTSRRLVWAMVAYVILNVLVGAISYKHGNVTLKALGYGLIVNTRFIVFFLAVWAVAVRTSRLEKRSMHLLLWPAIGVVAFGVLQVLILSHDFLRHFGYSAATIYPYETINHNTHYVRIISTLRGANPLGAYLIIPISLLTALVIRAQRAWWHIVLLLAGWFVLYFSFSRSAWIGAVISTVVISALSIHRVSKSVALAAGGVVVIVVLVAGFALAQHNSRAQNVLFHTEDNSVIKTTSNEGHASALKRGIRETLHEPLGRGTGTAGPASVYNAGHTVRYAENYYLQIGQELGWLGVLLFGGINITVGYLLYQRRSHPMAAALLASLVGISFVCLLSHAWTDDTLAYVWWGLAAIAITTAKPLRRKTTLDAKTD